MNLMSAAMLQAMDVMEYPLNSVKLQEYFLRNPGILESFKYPYQVMIKHLLDPSKLVSVGVPVKFVQPDTKGFVVTYHEPDFLNHPEATIWFKERAIGFLRHLNVLRVRLYWKTDHSFYFVIEFDNVFAYCVTPTTFIETEECTMRVIGHRQMYRWFSLVVKINGDEVIYSLKEPDGKIDIPHLISKGNV